MKWCRCQQKGECSAQKWHWLIMWLIPPPDRLQIYQIQSLYSCRLSNIAQDIKVISASGKLCSYYVTQSVWSLVARFLKHMDSSSQKPPLFLLLAKSSMQVQQQPNLIFLTFGVLADFCSFVPRRLSGSTVKYQIRIPNYAETKLKPDLISKTAP